MVTTQYPTTATVYNEAPLRNIKEVSMLLKDLTKIKKLSFQVDIFLGLLCMLFFIIGLPANILNLSKLLHHKRNVATIIYLSLAICDIFTIIFVFPTGYSLLTQTRDAGIYRNTIACHVIGIAWTVLPFLSVFITCVMSLTRAIVMTKPLLRIPGRVVAISIVIYTIYLTMRVTVPVLMGAVVFAYGRRDGYCWEFKQARWYTAYDHYAGVIQMAFPILPICISCLISIVKFYQDPRRNSTKMSATITVIIITFVYIIFNIPVIYTWMQYYADGYTIPNRNVFFTWYLWCITYVVLVAGNAAINPLVLLWRSKNFRHRKLVASYSSAGSSVARAKQARRQQSHQTHLFRTRFTSVQSTTSLQGQGLPSVKSLKTFRSDSQIPLPENQHKMSSVEC